jgi:hypothetical protein
LVEWLEVQALSSNPSATGFSCLLLCDTLCLRSLPEEGHHQMLPLDLGPCHTSQLLQDGQEAESSRAITEPQLRAGGPLVILIVIQPQGPSFLTQAFTVSSRTVPPGDGHCVLAQATW